MNRSLCVALGTILTATLTAGAVSASGPYQITGTTQIRDGSLVRSEFVVQAGPSPLDRFKMVRLAKPGPASQLRGSILFLPPLGTTFAFYEQRDPNGAFGSSIAEYFALRGFDVYGYSPRYEAIPAGIVFDGLMNSVVKDVAQFAKTAPAGLNLIPLFPPNVTSHQLFVSLLSTTAPGPISMPVPNFIEMNGSPAEDRLFFASEPQVFEGVLAAFNNYFPVVITRDISCSLAGIENRYTNHLGAFHGPVLAIGGGHAFGPFMHDNLALLGSRDQTFLREPGFGHIDHFMTLRHRELVEQPIFEWALRVFGERED